MALNENAKKALGGTELKKKTGNTTVGGVDGSDMFAGLDELGGLAGRIISRGKKLKGDK